MKKPTELHEIKLSDLKISDIIIISRHKNYGHNEHCFSLGIVKKTKKEILINIISPNYGTKDMGCFLESVELCPYGREIFNATKASLYIFKAPKNFISQTLKKQIKELNSNIRKLEKVRGNLEKLYGDK